MNRSRLQLITTADHANKRLDIVLGGWLPEALGRPVSKSKIRKLIMAGAVHLNARQVRSAAIQVREGMKVAVDIDPVRLFQDETSKDKRFELTSDRILYEDPDLILVDKPAGLPAHPTVDESRDNLFAAVTRFLEKRDGKTPYLGIHQRLDRDTSGIVLFTKSRQVNPALAELFSAHKIIKTYQALTEPRVSGKRKEKWTVRNRLGKMSSRGKRTRYGAVDSGGDFAETAFRVIEEYPVGLWIEAMPKTGRTHQIRVHLAEDGMPILGDDLYGGGHSHDLASRLMLHAVELKFPHPLSGVQLSVKSALPIDFVRVLDRMRNSKGL